MAGQKRGLFPREKRKEKKRQRAGLFFCGRSTRGAKIRGVVTWRLALGRLAAFPDRARRTSTSAVGIAVGAGCPWAAGGGHRRWGRPRHGERRKVDAGLTRMAGMDGSEQPCVSSWPLCMVPAGSQPGRVAGCGGRVHAAGAEARLRGATAAVNKNNPVPALPIPASTPKRSQLKLHSSHSSLLSLAVQSVRRSWPFESVVCAVQTCAELAAARLPNSNNTTAARTASTLTSIPAPSPVPCDDACLAAIF